MSIFEDATRQVTTDSPFAYGDSGSSEAPPAGDATRRVDDPAAAVLAYEAELRGSGVRVAPRPVEAKDTAWARSMEGKLIGGRYLAERFISTTTFGAVLRCRDRQSSRSVVLQIVQPALADTSVRRRYQREVDAWRSLQEAGLVEAIGWGIDDIHGCFLAWDDHAGESLQSFVERQGPIAVEDALDVIRQLARTLAGVHRNEALHRDLRPANTILASGPRDSLRVLIGGLGAARVPGLKIPMRGRPTPDALVRDGKEGPATDIWCLGATLYFALTGHEPYGAAGARAADVLRPPVPVLTRRPSLPIELARLVDAMLAQAPERRPSIDAIVAQVDAIAAQRLDVLAALPFRGDAAATTAFKRFSKPAPKAPPTAVSATTPFIKPAASPNVQHGALVGRENTGPSVIIAPDAYVLERPDAPSRALPTGQMDAARRPEDEPVDLNNIDGYQDSTLGLWIACLISAGIAGAGVWAYLTTVGPY